MASARMQQTIFVSDRPSDCERPLGGVSAASTIILSGVSQSIELTPTPYGREVQMRSASPASAPIKSKKWGAGEVRP